MKKIIYLDFDGVINSYRTKFDQKDSMALPDPPNDGAIDWLCKAVERFHIVIFTCRMLQPESEGAVHAWLFKHGMPNHLIDQLAFSCVKRGATCYIDDRAIQFRGTFPSLDELDSFKPWNREENTYNELADSESLRKMQADANKRIKKAMDEEDQNWTTNVI